MIKRKYRKEYDLEKIKPTNNILLRFIGSICRPIYSLSLRHRVLAEEDGSVDSLKYKIWVKISNTTREPNNRWATYYRKRK